MSKNLSRILTLVVGVIGLIGFFFFIRVMMVGDEAIENDAAVQASIVSPFVTFARLLLIFTALIAVVFSIWNLVKQPQVLKKALIAVGLLAVVLAVSYVLASDAEVTDTVGRVLEGGEAGSVSKWVSTGINFSFFLGAVGLLFFMFDFIKGLVK